MHALTKSDALGTAVPAATLALRFRDLEQAEHELQARLPSSLRHARRVARYAAATARRMKLPAEQVARIRRAAALHDVGKLGVAATIIDKPGPLSDEEYATVQGHAVAGAEMLTELDPELGDIIRHHHERFDGNGYPDGLAGEEIPLGARVIAVADTFDALTSRRPYRPARGRRQALALLVAEAGSQLDPRVVEEFRTRRLGFGAGWLCTAER
jgi:putative nucleotidyltransferase with HDIG domain